MSNSESDSSIQSALADDMMSEHQRELSTRREKYAATGPKAALQEYLEYLKTNPSFHEKAAEAVSQDVTTLIDSIDQLALAGYAVKVDANPHMWDSGPEVSLEHNGESFKFYRPQESLNTVPLPNADDHFPTRHPIIGEKIRIALEAARMFNTSPKGVVRL